MRYLMLILLCLFACSAIRQEVAPEVLHGNFFYTVKGGDFYDELTLQLKGDSTFTLKQRLGPETFAVSGTTRYLGKRRIALVVRDTVSWLRDEPIYDFYKVKDTVTFLNNNKILLNGKRFKRAALSNR